MANTPDFGSGNLSSSLSVSTTYGGFMTEEEFNKLTEEKQQKVLELMDEGKSEEEIHAIIDDAPVEFQELLSSSSLPESSTSAPQATEPAQALAEYDPSVLMSKEDLDAAAVLAAPIKKGKKILIDEDECLPSQKPSTKQKTDKRPIIKKLRKALRGDAYGIREG